MMKKALFTAACLAFSGCGLFGGEAEPPKPDSVVRGINYIGVSVDDVATAQAYYENALGAATVDNSALKAGNFLGNLTLEGSGSAEQRLVRITNAQLRLMSFAQRSADGTAMPAVPVQGPGIAHICFQVAEETQSYRNILAAGAEPIGSETLVQLTAQNPVHYGYVKDPQGIITEIEEVDLTKLNLPTPPRNKVRVRHVSFATPDLGPMMDFYSAFLGGQKPRHVGKWLKVSGETIEQVSGLEGSKIEMAWFQLRNLEIEIFQYHSHPTQRPTKPRPLDAPGYNMVVFDVSDLAAARQRVLDAGGEVVTKVGTLDDGEIIFARDPDGNLIGLQKLPAGSVFSAANFPDNGI